MLLIVVIIVSVAVLGLSIWQFKETDDDEWIWGIALGTVGIFIGALILICLSTSIPHDIEMIKAAHEGNYTIVNPNYGIRWTPDAVNQKIIELKGMNNSLWTNIFVPDEIETISLIK